VSYLACPKTVLPAADPQLLVATASDLFRRFHCFAPTAMRRERCSRHVPPVLTALGELRGIIYRSDRGQCGHPRTFIHFFESPPLLTCDPTGQRLHIVGGRYRVTRHGIEG
jgi:hypothetical protein